MDLIPFFYPSAQMLDGALLHNLSQTRRIQSVAELTDGAGLADHDAKSDLFGIN